MRLRRFLKQNGSSASKSEILAFFASGDLHPWTEKRLLEAAQWDQLHPNNGWQIRPQKGGRGWRLIENSESVGEGQGEKALVVRRLSTNRTFATHAFLDPADDLVNVVAYETGRRKAVNGGRYSRPDMILGLRSEARPRTLVLHTFEFQGKGTKGLSTFQIGDIAQAYVAGDGAHCSWVFTHRSCLPDNVRSSDEDWRRTKGFAEKLGIGIIGYGDAGRVNTWKTYVPAARRRRTERSDGLLTFFRQLACEHGDCELAGKECKHR